MNAIHWFHRVRSHAFPNAGAPLAAFYFILVSAVFGLSVVVPRFVGNLLVLGAYIVFIAAIIGPVALQRILDKHRPPSIPFKYHPAILAPTIVLWVVFVISLVLNPSAKALLRAGAFILLSAITLFVVPTVVSREQAFRAISIIGAVCVVVTLPVVVVGDVVVSGMFIDWAGAPIRLPGLTLYAPRLIFDGLNYFRVLVAFGTIAAAGVYARTRNRRMLGICVLDLFGVCITLGRTAYLATAVAGVLVGVYYVGGRQALAGVTALGVCITIAGFGIAVGVLPGPTALFQSILGERLDFYRTSWQAFVSRPVLGWGLVDTGAIVTGDEFMGVHNSYLRLFVIGGVVGGFTYLVLCAIALGVAFRRVCDYAPLALTSFCLVIMMLIFQLFDGGTIFGTSLSSLLWAMAIAYTQPGDNSSSPKSAGF